VSHLEDLLCEYYEWQGYIVRRNIKVGRLGHGGWEGELDIVELPVAVTPWLRVGGTSSSSVVRRKWRA